MVAGRKKHAKRFPSKLASTPLLPHMATVEATQATTTSPATQRAVVQLADIVEEEVKLLDLASRRAMHDVLGLGTMKTCSRVGPWATTVAMGDDLSDDPDETDPDPDDVVALGVWEAKHGM